MKAHFSHSHSFLLSRAVEMLESACTAGCFLSLEDFELKTIQIAMGCYGPNCVPLKIHILNILSISEHDHIWLWGL